MQLPRLDFVLTPTDMSKGFFGVLSRDIALNGQLLTAGTGADAMLPKLAPMGKAATMPNFVVPARSYGFAVYPDAGAPACK